MSNYNKIVDFSVKDALITSDPSKRILGTELDAELDAIAAAISSKLDSSGVSFASPTLSGTVSLTGTLSGSGTIDGGVF